MLERLLDRLQHRGVLAADQLRPCRRDPGFGERDLVARTFEHRSGLRCQRQQRAARVSARRLFLRSQRRDACVHELSPQPTCLVPRLVRPNAGVCSDFASA